MKKVKLTFYFWILLLSFNAQTLIPNDKFALLKGTVTNFKGKALYKEIIIFTNEKSSEVFKVITDSKGLFQVLIPVNATYSVRYKTFTTEEEYTKMPIPKQAGATYEAKIKIEPPWEIILDNVYFDSGKSTFKPASYKALNDLVEVLKLKENMEIEIQGHTDNVGTPEQNLKLSQERADAVKKYLISKGIQKNRVSAKGYGQSEPIADNAAEEGRAKNRRTSLKVLKQ